MNKILAVITFFVFSASHAAGDNGSSNTGTDLTPGVVHGTENNNKIRNPNANIQNPNTSNPKPANPGTTLNNAGSTNVSPTEPGTNTYPADATH